MVKKETYNKKITKIPNKKEEPEIIRYTQKGAEELAQQILIKNIEKSKNISKNEVIDKIQELKEEILVKIEENILNIPNDREDYYFYYIRPKIEELKNLEFIETKF